MNPLGQDKSKNRVLWSSILTGLVIVVLTLVLKRPTAANEPWIGLQWLLSGLTEGSVYALVAMGFSVIFASTRVINFAQGEFSMLGGMLFYTFSTRAGLPVWLGVILAVAAVTLIGAGFERIALRPLKNPSVITIIIITIGLSIFIRAVSKWIWGSNAVLVKGFTGEGTVKFLGASLNTQTFWVFGFAAFSVILVFLFFNRTLLGKGMRAAAANPEAANLVGVSPSTSSLVAWTIAAALGAAAGIVIAPIHFVAYSFGLTLGLKGFVAAILGGFGSPTGAVVGGLTLGILETIAAGVGPSGAKDAVAFVILILVLLLRPQGLLGKRDFVEA